MSRSGLGLAIGVIGLLGGAFALQRALASNEHEPLRDAAKHEGPISVRSSGWTPTPHIDAVPAGSDVSTAPVVATSTAPAGPVWRVLEQPHADVATEREALLEAFRSAPACDAAWCARGRETLVDWTTSVSKRFPGVASFDAIQCNSAGCWTQLTVHEPRKLPELTRATQEAMSKTGWPGSSIQGGPDFTSQRGNVVSIWAILPIEN